MPRGDLERGWTKHRLILQLAQAELDQRALATEYGVVQSSISDFNRRHADEIDHRRTRLADEWAGLWIADKKNRIAEAQEDVEGINTALAAEQDPALYRAKLAVMRQVAEELGQLVTKSEVTGVLNYVLKIDGFDPEALS